MTTPEPLQDSRPQDGRLLARLVQAGTVLLDERDRPTFASDVACELFGVPDLAALRAQWTALADPLRIDAWPRAPAGADAFCGRADLATPRGPCALRFEVHAIGAQAAIAEPAHRLVLVRDRSRLLPEDRALLLAAEALANRHVLMGLAHTAKGPLNNFNLTLALLAAGADRAGASADASESGARRTRYIGVLQSEADRLAACIDEIQALAMLQAPPPDPIDLAAMSREAARVLRHGATMREVSLDVDAPDRPVTASADARLVRLALQSFAICMVELTASGGRVGWRVADDGNGGDPSILFSTTERALPSALVAALFRLSRTTESEYAAAIAGRVIVEAQRGDVNLQDAGASPPGILLRIPAAR